MASYFNLSHIVGWSACRLSMLWFSVCGRSSVFVSSCICSLSHWTNLVGLATQVAALPYWSRVQMYMLNSVIVVGGDDPKVDRDRSLRRR